MEGASKGAPSSLVGTENNSAKYCELGPWLRGVCKAGHDKPVYLKVPCKRRSCEVCGPIGRYRIAQRIAYGVRQLWPAALQVLTFERDVTKVEAGRRLARYVRRLREGNPGLEYAATYELTEKGRLHINLLVARWRHVPQAILEKWWGARLWVSWVKDEGAAGRESAKSYSPESLAAYMNKLSQVVQEGRRVSYSKGWPKLPEPEELEGVTWEKLEAGEVVHVELLVRQGWLREVRPGMFMWAGDKLEPEPCACFEHV